MYVQILLPDHATSGAPWALHDGDLKEHCSPLDKASNNLPIELGHALQGRPCQALTQPKAGTAIPPDIVSSKIQVEKWLEPGEGFFSELHHPGVPDRPLSVKPNGDPDGTVDGILREERHRRD
jgi:hypothetical protein